MSTIAFNLDTCVKCGKCADDCPMGIIGSDNGAPSVAADKNSLCIGCGHCAAVCREGSVSIDGIDSSALEPIDRTLLPSGTATRLALRARRSVRAYRKKPVERETVSMLIDTARYAPTSGNSQLVRWNVIDSPPELRRVGEHVIDYLRHLVESGDPAATAYRFGDMIGDWENGKDRLFRGAPALVLAHAPLSHGAAAVDCSIALAFLDIASPSAELGTCWCGFFMMAYRNWEPLRKAISLPDGEYCFGAMMIGHPEHGYDRIPPRKEAVITWM